jgi:hypothetical protein
MHRKTQIEAYHKVKASGRLSRLRLQVYEIICYHGPITGMEIVKKIDYRGNSGAILTRITELDRMGVIYPHGQRTCNITSHVAIEWESTGEIPVPQPKRETKAEKIRKIKDMLNDLEDKSSPLLRGQITRIYNEVCKL